jgi:hypothetical protein
MPRGTATLYLSILLSERFGSQVSTETGRWATFRGSLLNPEGKLDGTPFALEIREGNYTEAMERWASHPAQLPLAVKDQLPPGPKIPESAIGVVNVTPHAQPSDRAEAPFHAVVHLARSDFAAASRVIDVTFAEGHLVSAALDVRSDQFPEIEYPVLRLDRVDLSGGFQGFIFEFSVNRLLVQDIRREHRPVRLPKNTYARKPATALSIAVNSVYNRYNLPSGYAEAFGCEGLISHGSPGSADPLKGAECSIRFHEYELEEDGYYPGEALSGEFKWHKDQRSLTVDLRYRKVDLTGPLALLMFAGANDLVRIEMTLLADIAEFKSSDQHGEVSYWSVHRHQNLGNVKPKRWWGFWWLAAKDVVVGCGLYYLYSQNASVWWFVLTALIYSLVALNGVVRMESHIERPSK